jgi:hypothetical protein
MTMKKLISAVLVAMLLVSSIPAFASTVPDRGFTNRSRQLTTIGNKVVLAEDTSVEVRLVGLNVDSLEFSEGGWQMQRTMLEALDNWHANIIRMPVHSKYWFQEDAEKQEKYRTLVDSLIAMASERGKYVDLDLHQYEYITQSAYDFWKDAAERYKNNPTVLFGVLNEAHDTTWDEWRNGGVDTKDDGTVVNFYGHQQLVEMIRDLGAKNIIIAGGLDWGYDLTGIVGEAEGEEGIFALDDQGSNGDKSKAGYGIMYDTHIYPWKGRTADWDKMMGTARKMYPILSGENGWDNGTIKAIEGQEYPEDSEKWYTIWAPEFFAFVNDVDTYGTYMNWTGWCFHPGSSPRIIDESSSRNDYNYSYLPTDYWGVYVKEEMDKVYGENLLAGKRISASSGSPKMARLAVDGDETTVWKDDTNVDEVRFIVVDLDGVYNIDKWAVRSVGAINYREVEQLKNPVDFNIMVSTDGYEWNTIEQYKNNTVGVVEKAIKSVPARYVCFEFTNPSGADDVLKIRELFVTGTKAE